MIRRTVLEWSSIKYGPAPDEIPAEVADRIAAVASASPLARRGKAGVLEHGRKALRARGVVGVVAAGGCALEILPKIDTPGEEGREAIGTVRRRLVHMLAVALDLKIEAGQVTALHWQEETLLEILIRLFTTKLIDSIRQGMPRRYLQHQDDLPVLRGRLDAKRQFTTLAAAPSLVACRYDELTADITLNQIMKAAVLRLSRIARTSDNLTRLRELSFAYADISDLPVSALRWDDVVLDRTNSRWRELLNLARLLLGDRFQTTSSGGADGFSLLFEMNVLFEEYVARMLKRGLVGTELRVVSQGGRLYCLQTEDQHGLFQTRPDILIKRGNGVIQVIDTKWKRIASLLDDPKQGVSQGDIYQMMAYGELYQSDALMLLYPHNARLGADEGLLAAHRITGISKRLSIATIDIAMLSGCAQRLAALVLQ
ncbi:restriction endonuclease [Sinorhizobium sp. RAC02]|uniref:McrC family protein n=1 Tax=Sinorhizobium sp. RAC02 TaxID=1842534 RepID=UPI00083DDB19|nr:restriction endonuclease [Sinorhizobium sp. RAC02]AOF88325.1 mcrBC 5-methylcytosine restriction system component family protein [Sinorhizobium sp. RAC02]